MTESKAVRSKGATRNSAEDIAARTQDAYSVNRYRSWTACIRMLMLRDYTAAEAEAIMRSKWARWAADASDKPYGKATAEDLARFLDDPRNGCTPEAVKALL